MTQAVTKQNKNTTPRRWFDGGPLSMLRDEMDELFTTFFGGIPATASFELSPSIDVSETDETVEVTTDLPGFETDDINVDINNNYLTISGETSEETKTENGNDRKYHRVERRHGSFSRTVRLPCAVDEEKTGAELKNGVLTVTLPKVEEAKGKKIAIKG